MADLLESRVHKLAQMSDHYRDLAAALIAENVSVEIAAVADAFDDEVVRICRECLGLRACPCQFRSSCAALNCADSFLGALSANKAGYKIN
jgi:tRNA splicing ligase